MVKWGEKIPNEELDELKQRLREIDDDGKAVKRLISAIAYKQGFSPAEIEETFGLSKKNVYLWLDRIEDKGLDQALYDRPKPGRPSKLSTEQLRELEAALEESPTNFGYSEETWTPSLVQDWVTSTYNVEYSLRHIRRLMDQLDM